MYDNNDIKCFLTGERKEHLIEFLNEKGLDNKTIYEILEMNYEEMLGFYELYIADNENDLDIFRNIINPVGDSYDDIISDYDLLPCKLKQCICYDEYNNFCKHFCVDVSGLKLYDVLNCNGDVDYLQHWMRNEYKQRG
jgi:hypothetical protein